MRPPLFKFAQLISYSLARSCHNSVHQFKCKRIQKISGKKNSPKKEKLRWWFCCIETAQHVPPEWVDSWELDFKKWISKNAYNHTYTNRQTVNTHTGCVPASSHIVCRKKRRSINKNFRPSDRRACVMFTLQILPAREFDTKNPWQWLGPVGLFDKAQKEVQRLEIEAVIKARLERDWNLPSPCKTNHGSWGNEFIRPIQTPPFFRNPVTVRCVTREVCQSQMTWNKVQDADYDRQSTWWEKRFFWRSW